MNTPIAHSRRHPVGSLCTALAVLAVWLAPPQLHGFVLTVTDTQGNPLTNGYRWLVEEDNTHLSVPGVMTTNTISLVIHKSYAPVVTNGATTTPDPIDIPLSTEKRYVVSVLANEGYDLGSANVASNQTAVTVVCNKHPIPTAQVTLFVVEDSNPVNNRPDPNERGLAGFRVVLTELLGGADLQDAFANPIGTSYQTNSSGGFIFDADGAPLVDHLGTGSLMTDEKGEVAIKYLWPGKFGLQVIPPPGSGWIQTSTLEGGPIMDNWVKAREPGVFLNGPGIPQRHTLMSFVNPARLPWAANPPNGLNTISGTLRRIHQAQPPNLNQLIPGPIVPGGYVALNDLTPTAVAKGLYATPCNPDGTFAISRVPDGLYQVFSWDRALGNVIAFTEVTVTGGVTTNLGNVLLYPWFGGLSGSVFYDLNQNGFRDPGEPGIPRQVINLRQPDGSIYPILSTRTDNDGNYELPEIPPFALTWMVAEVAYGRFKPTGMTTAVDDGGPIPPGNDWTSPAFGLLNPQRQLDMDPLSPTFSNEVINPNTLNAFSRTETGPFPLLTEGVFPIAGQNTIIDWGRFNYGPGENGGIAGFVNYNTTRAENDPRFGAAENWEPGVPRVQIALYQDANNDKVIDDLDGDGVVTRSDVDNYPFGWQYDDAKKGPEDVDRNGNGHFDPGDAVNITHTDSFDDNQPKGSQGAPLTVHGSQVFRGYDNLSTWNQVRPAVFDGAYKFTSFFPGGMKNNATNEVSPIATGRYIVEVEVPPGYELQKWEDRNIFFGDAYTPSPLLVAPESVGDPHAVPADLALFPGTPCAFGGQTLPLPDRKWVQVGEGRNFGCDFFLFTTVPKAARLVGQINNEFRPSDPLFGNPASPPFLPVSVRDWAENEVARVYSDEFGNYNAMVPSTYSVHVPTPSGVSPAVHKVVVNDPTMPDPNHPGQRILDPFYDPNYGQPFAAAQFLPGTTTFVAMFLNPVGAFAGNPDRTVDAEPPDGTPVIFAVKGPGGGPQVCSSSEVLTIDSAGLTQVANPAAGTENTEPRLVTRDYGFGAVTGIVTLAGSPLNILSWTSNSITATVPEGLGSGQLLITRGDNARRSVIGLTLTVGCGDTVRHVAPANAPATPIQDAIEAAAPGDLILVAPGIYTENVIMWKDVKLQGAGAPSTIIIGNRTPEAIEAWHAKVRSLLGGSNPFVLSETPGILVLGTAGVTFTLEHAPRIDGFGITASVLGSGIRVYDEGRFLRISNNKIKGSQGNYAGGITLGTDEPGVNIHNDFVTIDHNQIVRNGGLGSGGVALYRGSHSYVITDNIISGNFGPLQGGGILHEGLSDHGLIANNIIRFNEVFSDTIGYGNGGGIAIRGELVAGALSPGAGSVSIIGNLIQGNIAGQGEGGAIRVVGFNGQDIIAAQGDPTRWYTLTILNNIIVDNIASYLGGGLSLQDVCRAFVINNTVSKNDSSATSRRLFTPAILDSAPQAAGLTVYEHSSDLAAASGQVFTDPVLQDNIFWQNRSFYVDHTLNEGEGGLVQNPNKFYWDLQVVSSSGASSGFLMHPTNCILSDTTGYDVSNLAADPLFIESYTNDFVYTLITDETGTFIQIGIFPLVPTGDYHIQPGSPAISLGGGRYVSQMPALALDFDRQTRPDGLPDAGADENSLTAPVSTPSSPGPSGNLLGPSLIVSSHTNDQVLSGSTITLAGTASDGGRGNSGVASVTVNSVAVGNGTAPGADVAAWSLTVKVIVGLNTFVITATDGGSNHNTTVEYLTVNVISRIPIPTATQPIVRLDFNEASGTTTTNAGSAGGLFKISTPIPRWNTTNVAPFVGATSSLDFGTVPGDFGVDSPGVLEALKHLTKFTITGWINNRSSSEGGDGNRIVRWLRTVTGGQTGTGGGQGADLVYHSDGRLELAVNRTPNGTARSNPGRIPTSSGGNTNNWRFFAVTCDATLVSSNVQFFFGTTSSNATRDVVRNYSLGPIGTNIGILTIGHFNPPSRSGSQTRMFRGLMDEIQIFGTVLTPSEIISVQHIGASAPPPPPAFVRGFPEANTQYPDTDGIDTDGDGIVNNDNVVRHLAAGDGLLKMADGTDLYSFGFSDVTGVPPDEVMTVATLAAEFPAPTLALKEGQKFYLKLSNVGMMLRPDLFDPHSVHFHGFPNAAPVFDGVPDSSIVIAMGSTLTYFYDLVTPGTFIYHCHVEATEHMQMGMLGQLYVQPRQNNLPNGTNLRGFIHQTGNKYVYNDGDGSTLYDVEYPIQISGFDRTFHELHLDIQPLPFALMKDTYPMLNGRGYPDTLSTNAITNINGHASQKINALINSTRGQKILLRISSLATVDFQTLTVQGIPMKVIGKGASLLRGPDPDGPGPLVGKNLYYDTSSVTLGGGETVEVILDTSRVGTGTYFLYATRLHALSNDQEDNGGMMTEIVVR